MNEQIAGAQQVDDGNGAEQATLAPKVRHHRTTAAGKDGWKDKFLASLRRIPNVTVACAAAHVTDITAYSTRKKDDKFRAAWARALNRGIERLEEEAWRRAKDGTVKNVWMKNEKGKPVKVDKVREYSDVLAIFLLKAHKPEKYRENLKAELSGPGGAPLLGKQTVIIAWPHELAGKNGNGNGGLVIEEAAPKQIEAGDGEAD